MSKRADIERGKQGDVFRHGMLVHGAPGERINPDKLGSLMLTCGVCHETFSEEMAGEHLKKCQPHGAKCGKCGQMFMPDDLVPHYKRCLGRLLETKHAD